MSRYWLRAGLAVLVFGGSVIPIAAAPPAVGLPDAENPSDFFANRRPPARTDAPSPVAAPAAEPARHRNPLWAIPLKNLRATHERPIFVPTRRPPPPVVPPPAYVPPPAPPPQAKPAEPERPQLVLVGTVVNSSEAFGIFLDRATNSIVRLKTGESHDGWILRSVQGRQAMLEKDRHTAMLALPARDAENPEGPPTVIPPTSAEPERFRTMGRTVDD
jgi:general secretion pathway protein N